jgi:hypothetical protein
MRNFLTILILLGLFSFACHQKTHEEIEGIISKSSSLREVNELCTQLPKPTGVSIYQTKIGLREKL